MSQIICQKDGVAFYSDSSQTDWWASQGYTVFELTPQRVAGTEELDDGRPRTRTETIPATEVVPDVSSLLTKATEESHA